MPHPEPTIGVLAVQGDVSQHVAAMQRGLEKSDRRGLIIEVKKADAVEGLDALLLPGGESTTMGKLLTHYGIDQSVKQFAESGKPVLATCAGLILLAKEGDVQVEKTKQPLLGVLDVKVNRNAFGRQRESFEASVDLKGIASQFPAVFIRAPAVEKAWGRATVLGKHEDRIVAVKQENILALAFHPELADDTRIHEYFLSLL